MANFCACKDCSNVAALNEEDNPSVEQATNDSMPENKNLMLLLKDRQYKITSYTVWLPNWVECYDVRGITDPGNHGALVSCAVKFVAAIHASRFPVGPIQVVLEHCQSMRLLNKLKNKM